MILPLRLPYTLAAQLASGLAALVPPGGGKVRQSLAARAGVVRRWRAWAKTHRDPSRPLAWFHAPSVGEGLQARPVIELVRERHPELQLVYSYFSPSARKFAEGLAVDYTDFLPFDTPGAAAALLDALTPAALVFSKLDVWPLLAEAAASRGVGLGMTSATVAPTSARQGRVARALLRDAHARFSAVGAISADDAERLIAIGFPRDAVSVSGDTRYDQVIRRAATVDRHAPPVGTLQANRPTLVAGSTWPSDEAVLLAAWERIRSQVAGARLIVAPHEPTAAHLAPIEAWAERVGINCARLGAATPATDVVLVDRVGVLGDLYALASAAWVGGGFHAAGLHSVLEPAAFGAPVLFGPRHLNARDAGLLINCGGGRVVGDVAGAAHAIEEWLTHPRGAGDRALQLVREGGGASERSYALVRRLMLGA